VLYSKINAGAAGTELSVKSLCWLNKCHKNRASHFHRDIKL